MVMEATVAAAAAEKPRLSGVITISMVPIIINPIDSVSPALRPARSV